MKFVQGYTTTFQFSIFKTVWFGVSQWFCLKREKIQNS